MLLTEDKSDAIKVMKKLEKREEKISPKKNPFFKFINKFIYIHVPNSHPNANKRIKNIESIHLENKN